MTLIKDTSKKFNSPLLIAISAPSGAGKTTLCKQLLKDFGEELTLSISSTTRSIRGEEENGKDYFFVSKESFEEKIKDGAFAEWANVHDQYYGTAKETIEKSFSEGKSILLDIDVQGAKSLKQTYPNRCVTIFIAPPSMKTLEERLRGRGTDPEESIQRRLENARKEMDARFDFDLILVNDSLEKTYKTLKEKVQAVLN
jgi:guanylate kinase